MGHHQRCRYRADPYPQSTRLAITYILLYPVLHRKTGFLYLRAIGIRRVSDRDTTGTVGDEADQAAIGSKNRQQAQNMRAGDTNVYGGGSDLTWRVLDLTAQVRELTKDVDNLPARVTRLEGMEVVVRPSVPEVVIRPAAPDSVVLNTKTVLTILIVAFLLSISFAVVLVFMRLNNV